MGELTLESLNERLSRLEAACCGKGEAFDRLIRLEDVVDGVSKALKGANAVALKADDKVEGFRTSLRNAVAKVEHHEGFISTVEELAGRMSKLEGAVSANSESKSWDRATKTIKDLTADVSRLNRTREDQMELIKQLKGDLHAYQVDNNKLLTQIAANRRRVSDFIDGVRQMRVEAEEAAKTERSLATNLNLNEMKSDLLGQVIDLYMEEMNKR